jgi:cytochrome P450
MAMYLLAKNQGWQGQLREKIRASTVGQLCYEQLDDAIPLLDFTFKEVLRMYPPVPGVVRRTVRPSTIGGFEVPAHTIVNTSIVANHYSEEYWSDPFSFDPMRFSDARQEHKQHPFLWTPFGGGAHKCIGLHFANMLFKCVLFQTIKQFRIEFVDEKQRNGKISYVPFTRLKDNLPLTLSKVD